MDNSLPLLQQIQLGQLPEFGSGRGLSGASLNHSSTDGGFHDLDNALESLLEDNSEKRGGGRQKAKTRGKNSTSKYVNLYRIIVVHI